MKRIVCVGNRLVEQDAAGPLVFDALCAMGVPQQIEVIDAGLAGIDVLTFLDGAERVVFVDAVAGDSLPGVVVLNADETAAKATGQYSHDAGLEFALRMAPMVCDHPLPEVAIVGVEGLPTQETIAFAADLSVELAESGEATAYVIDDVASKDCE